MNDTLEEKTAGTRDIPLREMLLQQGMSFEQICDEELHQLGRRPTKQAISAYAIRRPLLKQANQAARLVRQQREQEDSQQKSALHQTLCSLLLQYRNQELKKFSLPVQKAYAYTSKRLSYENTTPFDKVVALLTCYYDARRREEKFSLEELSSVTEISPITVSRILKAVGEEPMYGTYNKHHSQSWQRKAIDRMYNYPYAATTVAYFLGIDEYVVFKRWKAKGEHKIKHIRLRIFFFNGRSDVLTPQRISEIYEAYDAGIKSRQDIAQLTGRSNLAVQYVLDHRQEIEPQIRDIIRKIYNSSTYDKPYVSQTLKEI